MDRFVLFRRTGKASSRSSILIIFDQVLSSGTNVLLVVAAGRGGTRVEFGKFSIIFGIFTLGLGLRAATLGDLALVVGTEDNTGGLAAGSSFYLGTVVGILSGGIAAALGLGLTLAGLCLIFPFLFIQDAIRSYSFSRRDPVVALGLDATWLIVQVALLAILSSGVRESQEAWVAGGLVSFLIGLFFLKPEIRFRRQGSFLSRRMWLVRSYAVQYALSAGTSQLLAILIGAFGRIQDVGSVRGAQTILGPYNVIMAADRVDLVTRMQVGSTRRALNRRLWISGSGLLLLAVLFGIVGRSLPSALGYKLLGPSWKPAVAVLPALTVQAALLGIAQPYIARLTATLRTSESVSVRAFASVAALAPFIALAPVVGSNNVLILGLSCLMANGLATLALSHRAAASSATIASIAVDSGGGAA